MFEKISIHTPRQFVPADLNTGDWAGLAPLFEQLEQQLSAATNAEQLEQVIETIIKACKINGGKIGDGKIFVSSLEQVIRIRTGETGPEAV